MTNQRNRTLQFALAAVIVLGVGYQASAIAKDAGPLKNLAPSAKISATSEYNSSYQGKFVADGKIPGAGSARDLERAWVVKGETHRNGAAITFEWAAEITVAEIVYYGRTAFEGGENWKDYELYVDSSTTPAVKGRLKSGHGPQRITLARATKLRKFRIKFTSSYGGTNPGASEIQVYSSSPPANSLGKLVPFAAPRRGGKAPVASAVPESPELAADLKAGKLGFDKLVMIQRAAIQSTHVYTYHAEGFKPGGGLYVLTLGKGEDSLKKMVDSPKGEMLDCNVSYDGKEILFSWRRTPLDTYHVYRIQADGSGLVQVTRGKTNNMNACWLPDGGIAYLSDLKPAFAYCWNTTSPILYRCDADGGNIVRLSANYLNDFTPSVMPDGRIIYSRWEYVDRPAIPIQSLWTINQDGTNVAGYFGNRVLSPATFMEAREIPGTNTVLCVLTAHNGPCRGGIGIIDPSKGANAQDAITNLTTEINIGLVDKGSGNHIRGPYESPFPVDDKYFLVSRGGTILLRDYKGTAQATVQKPTGGLGFYSAQPIRATKRPRVRPSTLKPDSDNWAMLTMQDVYNGLEPHIKRGEIKQIAIVQEIEKSVRAEIGRRAFGFQFPVVSCGATYAPKRVWGYAKIESDGSASFKVPAGLPIYFMALDAEGRALQRMRSFTHLMPGERQGCVGCHADRNYATSPAASKRAIAALRAPQELDKPEWGVEGFSYSRIVQPVFDKHCIKCHNPRKYCGGIDLTGDKTDFFNVSYEYLARQGRPGQNPYTKWIPSYNGQEANILHVTPKYWGSPASKLAENIRKGHPDKDGKKRVDVSAPEQERVFIWIDLNVPYYGTSSSNHYNLRGCRQMVPPNLNKVLAEVSKRRCASCHKGNKIPRRPYIRITNVENSEFLLAPLAKSAGGTEKCGKAIFADKDDPDYKAILKTFDPVIKMYTAKPRMDMPGAKLPACPSPGN
ncbi:MAG: hypothetical protein ISS69_12680 [Phycisphaerae bacterium]|nr:hypothetical protein [Phycisphaerae bacterium]